MSLHARSSPQAEATLESQRRTSVVTSMIIAVLVVVLVLLVLFFVLLPSLQTRSPLIVAYSVGGEDEEVIEQKRVNLEVKQTPAAPSASVAKVIASTVPSPTAVPVPDLPADPSTEFGSSDDFGAGWGTGGDGGGGGFGRIPASMRKRCSKEDRLQRLARSGGTPQCEDAVVKSLRWFKQVQHPNGSWGSGHQVAMTGLVLLAYLGHCETPLSEEFGETVTKAIVYLVDNSVKQRGRLATNLGDRHWVYEHGVATYALAEAYTFSTTLGLNIPNLRESVQSGVQWIIDNQNKSGGWDYAYEEAGGRGGDLSITAWQLQALKAGYHTRLEFRNFRSCVTKALRYCQGCQDGSGGFGYAGKNPVGGSHHTLTGAGVLCFQQHKGTSNHYARRGMSYIDKNSRFNYKTGPCNLYEHYYSSQAAINHGGKSWLDYNAMFRDQLLQAQRADGSFPPPPNPGPGAQNDPVYHTALATLMLEVYYRFLPGTGLGL